MRVKNVHDITCALSLDMMWIDGGLNIQVTATVRQPERRSVE